MQKDRKNHASHGFMKSLLWICLILMIFSQICLISNRLQIKWYKQKVMNVSADNFGELIIATDVERNKAGAMNYWGETVIPFENSIFDPWTGDLISQGLYYEGSLYWVNKEGKVGIVNAENKEIIPREYGYLKRGLENQFIAGIGTLSEVVSGGGQYINKKYGIIAEGNLIVVPLQYDELSISEDGTYYGIIYEDAKTIRRSLKTDGTIKNETVEEIKEEQEDTEGTSENGWQGEGTEQQEDIEQENSRPENAQQEGTWPGDEQQESLRQEEAQQESTQQEDIRQEDSGREDVQQEGMQQEDIEQEGAWQEDTQQEDTQQEDAQQEGAQQGISQQESETKVEDDYSESELESETNPEDKESDIQDYDGGQEESYTIQDKYNDGEERSLHYHNGTVTLELLDQSTVLIEFAGKRTPDVNEPIFTEDEKMIIDNWEGSFYLYSARDGQLLCNVNAQTDYLYTGTLLAYWNEGMYEVKNLNNQVLFSAEAGEQDRFMNSVLEKPRFVFQEDYFVYQGDPGRTLITNQGVIIAKDLDVIYYNIDSSGEEEKDQKIFVCEKDGKFGAFSFAGEKILNFIYKNVEFFQGHVKALRITDDRGKVGIMDYSGNLIIPIEYDNVGFGANIRGADSRLIENFTMLYEERQNNRYLGQKGNEIYYLNENGEIVSRVQYVLRQEQSGGGLADLLAFRKQMENRIVYRTTGNQRVMSNAFGTGWTYRRSQVTAKLNSKGITFLCIDTVGGQIGIYDHTYGAFSFMGYQQSLYNLWLAASRLFLLLAFFIFLGGLSYQKLFWKLEERISKWRKKDEKKE